MTILFCNNGEAQSLRYVVNKDGLTENLIYRLFTNNITPAETDVAGSYTEAGGGGYASIEMLGASWTITPGAPSSAAYAQQQWGFTGPLTAHCVDLRILRDAQGVCGPDVLGPLCNCAHSTELG